MISIDIPTALLFNSLLYLLMPTVAWFVLAQHRTVQITLWCLGGWLTAVAIFLTILLGRLPDWLAMSVGNYLFFFSMLVRVQSLRMDLGKPITWRLIVGVMLFFIIGLEYFDKVATSVVMRVQFQSVMSTVVILGIALSAGQISRQEKSLSAAWISGAYGALIVAGLLRVFYVGTHSDHGSGILKEHVSGLAVSLAMAISAVVGHLAYIGMALDRSARREMAMIAERSRAEERRKLADQIAQLDRQRGLGELSASLGHELNQPLATILTSVQTARRGIETGYFQSAQLIELLDKVAQSTRRASQIIERIRDYIRPSAMQPVCVDLQAAVGDAIELIADEARRQRVRIVRSPQAEPVIVSGDAIQLSQIILNVARNAVEAMQNTDTRELHIDCRTIGRRARVSLRDTGSGIPAETLARIGAPFFTTKSAGLGMGIVISRSIAEHHGGTLSLRNADDHRGLVVELDLPAAGVGAR